MSMDKCIITDYPWHQSSWESFVSARSQNHLPHALLISAMDGTGKQDFAKKIVTALLCTAPIDNKACQNCRSCKTYQAGANPDYLQVELLPDKKQISIGQIRQVSEFISYTRSFESYRVILINPVERMNINAANGLLKSLEEPASNTVIILVASNIGQILPTIKSRCQLLALPSPTKEQALEWLKQQTSNTKIDELLSMANGQPLTVLNMSDENIQGREDFSTDLQAICVQEKSLVEIAKKWEKFDHAMLLNWQISWVQNIIKKNSLSNTEIKHPQETLINSSSHLDNCIPPINMWVLYQQLIDQKKYIHTSVNPLLSIENMLLLWLQASRTQ